MDLSVRGGRTVKGKMERTVGGSRLWRWPRDGKSKLGKVTKKLFCRG